jgi:hypothetical protein
MSFFITSIAFYPEVPKYDKPYKVTRTFGHFGTLERARQAVDCNECDISESLYNYLVIEELPYGIHALADAEHQWWYLWNDTNSCWLSVLKPAWSNGFLNWGLG